MTSPIYITLLRHGRSRADDEQVHEGRYDSPLTYVGREQARQRAQEFLQRGFLFDRIIASTMQRADETACIFAETLQVPMESDPEWVERDNGPLAGMPFDIARELYPRPSMRTPYTPIAGSGESYWDLYTRATRAVQNLIQRGPGSYLVVAHGAILNYAFMAMVGLIPSVNYQGFVINFGVTGYARLCYYPDEHQWKLLEFIPGELTD